MLIECSISNCLIFIPFIFPIFFQIEAYINKEYIKQDNKPFKLFRYFLSHIFAIIFIIIIKCRSKPGRYSSINNSLLKKRKENKRSSIWINPLDIQQKKLKIGKKIKSVLFLIILSIISILSNVYNKNFKKNEFEHGKLSIGIFFEIIHFVVLSMIILNEKLYIHHNFSLWIISFTLLILTISFIITEKEETILKALLFYFLIALFYCSYDVLGKKYMLLYFISPYTVMLYIGLIGCFILIIYDIITYFHYKEWSGIIICFGKNISFKFVFIFLGDIFLQFIWNLGIWLTIYFFNPCYFIISELISEGIYFYFFDLPNHKNDSKYSWINIILYSVSYFINIVASLVFNEIIIINCFGLNEFTKKKIRERERLETLSTFNNVIDRDSRNMFNSIN